MPNITIHITEYQPVDKQKWDDLCRASSNFFQSTAYDEVSAIFGNTAVYFECYHNNVPVAGQKIYVYWSARKALRYISRSAHSYGEAVCQPGSEHCIAKIGDAIYTYLKTENIHFYKSKPVYGGISAEKACGKFPTKAIELAVLPIGAPIEELYSSIYKTHRRYIGKAEKEGLRFSVENDFDAFYELLLLTYAGQRVKPPAKNYLQALYCAGRSANAAELCFVSRGSQKLSAVLALGYGRHVEYMHGGSIRSMAGSNHLLHYSMMKRYNALGYITAGYGMVSFSDAANRRFETVSDFKMKFGCRTIEGYQSELIVNRFANNAFNMLKKIKSR